MDKQRKIARNLGRDTHVRNHSNNIHHNNVNVMLVGEVLFPEPEPLFEQNLVTVQLAEGGRITSVPYPGAFFEPVTGNMHGIYEGPIPGQEVVVGFTNNNHKCPFVINRYPYQGVGNSSTELAFKNPMFKAGFHSFDIVMGHFSGSFISFNTGIFPSTATPGSITISSMTDIEMSALLQTTISSLLLNLSSTGDMEITTATLIKIASATQSMKTLIDGLMDVLTNFGTVGTASAQTTDPATKALIAAEKAKWAALLKA